MKNESGKKIKTEFVGLTPKIYSYLIDERSGDRRTKGTKKSVMNLRLNFKDYKNVYKIIKLHNDHNKGLKSARSFVVSDLRPETKGSRFESGC